MGRKPIIDMSHRGMSLSFAPSLSGSVTKVERRANRWQVASGYERLLDEEGELVRCR